MINLIISGISNALFETFGYENYATKIPQELETPCFFIHCIEPKKKKYIGTRYLRQNHFVIQYFPQSEDDGNMECNNTGEQMFECLEVINADGFFLRGTEMRFEIVDGVLHFFVDYNSFVRKVKKQQTMGSLQTGVHVKG